MKNTIADNNVFINSFNPSLLQIELTMQKKKNVLQKVLLRKEKKSNADKIIMIGDLIAINLSIANKKAKKQFNNIRFSFA